MDILQRDDFLEISYSDLPPLENHELLNKKH